MAKTKYTFVQDGGKYSVYDKLVWRVLLVFGAYTDVTVTIGGFTIAKQVYSPTTDYADVLISDILEQVKTNIYSEFNTNFNGFADFTDVELSAVNTLGTETITIQVLDSLASPDAILHSKQFLTRAKVVQHDSRFEQGLFFYGQRQINVSTRYGTFAKTAGTANKFNYFSLRNGINEAKVYANLLQSGVFLNNGLEILGFSAGDFEHLEQIVVHGTATVAADLAENKLIVSSSGNAIAVELKSATSTIFYLDFSCNFIGGGGRLAIDTLASGENDYWCSGALATIASFPVFGKFLQNGGIRTVVGGQTLFIPNNDDMSNIFMTDNDIFE